MCAVPAVCCLCMCSHPLSASDPSPELLQYLSQFYESMFAKPSPFELPPGIENPSLHTLEMREILGLPDLQGHDRHAGGFIEWLWGWIKWG